MTKCSISTCFEHSSKKGFCTKHYGRFWRHGNALAGRTSVGVPLAWINEHEQYSGDDCLLWPFSKNNFGYARVYLNGKMVLATRVMCDRINGVAPTGKHEAAHTCGNGKKGCCSPKHLVWKDRTANQADRLQHGTDNRGERHYGVKLSVQNVLEIRRRTSIECKEFAKRFDVSPSLISLVRRRKCWAWLENNQGERT